MSEQKSSLISVRDNFKKRKSIQQLDIDPEEFKKEIEELVEEYNSVLELQQQQLSLIKKARNEKLGVENEIKVLEKAIRELEADYSYCESPHTPDVIDCPTCGTGFDNSVADRFGILDDMDYCFVLVDQRKRELISVVKKIQLLDKDFNVIMKQSSSIDHILKKKRNDVTFSDVVASEGYKEMVSSISADITSVDFNQTNIDAEIIKLKPDLKVDTGLRKNIVAFYQKKMKEALNKLNVQVLTEEDYKTPARQIKANALGSDLPRSLLAQYMSFLQVMNKYNDLKVCPLVIDSPLQQEQDGENAVAIFNFILTNTLDNQQLILGTLDLKAFIVSETTLKDCNEIHLDSKYSLLLSDEYAEILSEVSSLHEATLSTE